jgi:outer membrane protein assembly factor BamB
MKKVLFFAFLLFIVSCSTVESTDDLNELSPTLQWVQSIYNDDSETVPENPQAFTLSTDDNVLVLMDTSILRYSEAGEYIDVIPFNHSLSAIKSLDADGYLVIGNIISNLVVTKLDANLNREWQQTHFVGDALTPNGIAVLDDAYFISGLLSNNSWIFKLDLNGNLIWENRFEDSDSEMIKTIKATTDNHIITVGLSNSDVWALKLNTDGTIIWETTLGGNGTDKGHDINENIDGNYTVLASTNSNTGDFDGIENVRLRNMLVKLDKSSGAIINVNGIKGNIYPKVAVQDANDELFIICEDKINVFNAQNRTETAVLKADANGNRKWQMNIFNSSYGETPFAAMKTSNNGLIVLSRSSTLTDYDGYLLYKINPEN